MSTPSSIPVRDLFDLQGKTAIVTGGTGGIGVATTAALAEAGANIVSIQVPNDSLGPGLKNAIEKHNRTISVFECDLKDPDAIQRTFKQIWDSGVVPDILVNGAGITHHSKIVDTTIKTIENVRVLQYLDRGKS